MNSHGDHTATLLLLLSLLVVGLYGTDVTTEKDDQVYDRPVIGILSQEPSISMMPALEEAGYEDVVSYIAASYVKSVESAGARVVPILINQPDDYYVTLAGMLNGFMFPGGAVSITNTSGYGAAGDLIYQLVISSNGVGSRLPLWATCLGFEMLVYLAAGRTPTVTGCDASNRADPLYMEDGWSESKLFEAASSDLMAAVQTMNITSNWHQQCVLPQTFYNTSVSANYTVLSTNYDDNNILYVSTIEHQQYPIFGTQWHPEKPAYEWKNPSSIPHEPEAVELDHYVMGVFVGEARLNSNRFSNESALSQLLIYNYAPVYTDLLYDTSFQQCYIFTSQDT